MSSSTSELACTCAALILYDDGVDITADNIATLVKTANVPVEPYYPGLFAKLFETNNIADLITNLGGGGGGPAVAGAPDTAAAGGEAKEEEKKKEESEEEEEDDDMGFSLFD